MKKGLLIGGGVAVVVVVAAGIFLWSNLGSAIKAVIEKAGPEIVQAKVTLNEVDLSPTSGEGALKGLVIGNPAGFKTESAFKMGSVGVKVDTGTVTSNTIVIKEVVIQAPEVTYELGDGGSNLDAIKRNADAFTKKMGGGSSAAPAKDEGGGKKLIIENLYVKDGKVNVSAAFLQGKAMGSPLPAIHLKDIGKKENGATVGEVADKVISAITASAGSAVASLNLGDLAKKAGAQVDAAKGQAGDLMKKATEGGSGAADTVKNLFGGSK